jgi:hypothetical protein
MLLEASCIFELLSSRRKGRRCVCVCVCVCSLLKFSLEMLLFIILLMMLSGFKCVEFLLGLSGCNNWRFLLDFAHLNFESAD